MTKKDYELVASVLLNAPLNERTHDNIVEDFVDVLKADNPRFDATKFRIACGKE